LKAIGLDGYTVTVYRLDVARKQKKNGSVYQRGKLWWIKYYSKGKPVYESSHSVRPDDADRLLKKRLGEIATGSFRGIAPERTTLDELFDLVVADYRENGKRSLDDVQSRLKLHLRPKLGALRAADFGSAEVRRYKATRSRQNAKPATVNRELSILKRAFSLGSAHEPQLVKHNPRIEKLTETNTRTSFLEQADYERLLAELPDYLKLSLVIGYHTGCRLGELMSLRWADVNLDGGEPSFTILAEVAKNKHHRTIPIYGDMLPALHRQRAERDEKYPALDWVFHDGTGQRLKTFYKAWASACERAKMDGQLFHDLRRSAVRNMVRAGIPEKLAMAISGHKTRHVFDRYNIVVEKDLANAGAMLTQYLAAQPHRTGA
jgi:integrase